MASMLDRVCQSIVETSSRRSRGSYIVRSSLGQYLFRQYSIDKQHDYLEKGLPCPQ